jgi:hypothetical protein
MPVVNRVGRFKAAIIERGIGLQGENQLVTFICKFALTHEYIDGDWADIAEESLEATAYCYLTKKDQSVNDFQVRMLQEALEWHDGDPMSLQESPDFEGKLVQITTDEDEYKGRVRIRVGFINHIDWSGAVPKADAATARTIRNRIGAQIRAMSGGSPAPAKKPGKAPSSPPKSSSPAKTDTLRPTTATQEKAWEAFLKCCAENWDQQTIEKEWFDVLSKITGTDDPEAITPEQWAQVVNEVPGLVLPV